ncbi:MAG: alpha/beta fold hydrolase [Janthinobacterium lividum]
MKTVLLALPLLLGTPALAQILPAPPTHAQGVAADTRHGATFTDNGTIIFYQVTGSGTPLILIHGYPLSGALFQYQQVELATHFQVITLDLPGFGRSSAPSGFGSTTLYAHYVLDLMNHLGIERAIIGGHSMGGLITQEIYREAPQRFLGMILIDTIAMAASEIERGEWAGYGLQSYKGGVSSIINIVTPQLLTGDTRHNNPTATTGIEDIIAEASVAGGVAGAETLAVRPNYTPYLSAIAVPVLVVEGLEDPVYGFPIAQALATQVPHGTLALLPNASHVSIYENPDLANKAITTWASANGF